MGIDILSLGRLSDIPVCASHHFFLFWDGVILGQIEAWMFQKRFRKYVLSMRWCGAGWLC